jgi:hypothetical protein
VARVRVWYGFFLEAGAPIAMVLGAIAFACATFSGVGYHAAMEFDRSGDVIPVTVSELWSQSFSKTGYVTYHGRFDYTVAGEHFSKHEWLSFDEFSRFRLGEIEQMRVMPDNPISMETTLGETRRRAVIVRNIALGFAALGLVVLIWSGSRAFQTMRSLYGRRSE